MRAIVIAIGTVLAIGLVAGPQAVATLADVEVPVVVGSARAVWCGPDDTQCCGEPIVVPGVNKEIENPVKC